MFRSEPGLDGTDTHAADRVSLNYIVRRRKLMTQPIRDHVNHVGRAFERADHRWAKVEVRTRLCAAKPSGM